MAIMPPAFPATPNSNESGSRARRRRISVVDADRTSEPARRILDAAEVLLAQRGFEGATLRDITEAADVNIASANYYFGSKDELMRQVLDRCMLPYSQARVQALTARQTARRDETLPLPEIVEALVRPMVELSRDSEGGRRLIRLLLHVRARPTEATLQVFTDRVDPAIHAFVKAFGAAAPWLSTEDLYWRYNFAVGAVMQVLTDADPAARRLQQLSGGLCQTDDDEAIIRQLVAFLSAGFGPEPSREQAPS